MKQSHYGIIGASVGGTVFLIIFFTFGPCILGICETEIEISEFKTPSDVTSGETTYADFLIINKGNEIAKNCFIHWRPRALMMPEVVSNSFSLNPGEEIMINLKNTQATIYLGGRGGFVPTTAWVVCDNSESIKIQHDIRLHLKP